MTSSNVSPRVLIAASGTGGHLLPAVQIAKALQSLSPTAQIEFIGSGRPLEQRLVDGAGFRRHVISTVGLKNLGILGFGRFLYTLPRAVTQVWQLLKSFRPDAVVGVGGYVSFLPVLLARLRGVPTWIHEAELSVGTANAALGFFATKASIAFADARIPGCRNVIYTGHPIRTELKSVPAKSPTRSPVRLLIMGGSQGAKALDQAILNLSPLLKQRGLELWHQCRAESRTELTAAYANAGITARVEEFIDDIVAAYTWADAVICRAGAGTVMEIEALNIPTIFVPYPYAQGNHQAANAATLARRGKAFVVEEGPGFDERLQKALAELLLPAVYSAMLKAPAETRSHQAATAIATGVLQMREIAEN